MQKNRKAEIRAAVASILIHLAMAVFLLFFAGMNESPEMRIMDLWLTIEGEAGAPALNPAIKDEQLLDEKSDLAEPIVSEKTIIKNDKQTQTDSSATAGKSGSEGSSESGSGSGNGLGNDTATFTSVEQMPRFPGGTVSMQRFIGANLKYPKAARENSVEGRVLIHIIVTETGEVSDIKIAEDIGSGCGTEAMRIVKMMPAWKPGFQNGKAVRVRLYIPIIFRLR